MSEAIWATWYDLLPEDEQSTLDWLHSEYLPFLQSHAGYTWVAHYRNVGHGPSLATYKDTAGHTPDADGVEKGSQFVILVGAPTTHSFYHPLYSELPLPAGFGQKLAARKAVRTAVFSEEARVNGPAIASRLPGATPGPAIQFGTYRIRTFDEELSLAAWYVHERFPLMSKMPGSVLTRKLLSSVGWAKHGVIYEFESLDARTRHFEEPHEAKFVDAKAWVGKIVRSTLHTPGSPLIGERIWPPVKPASP
jgi:hypothetical protein